MPARLRTVGVARRAVPLALLGGLVLVTPLPAGAHVRAVRRPVARYLTRRAGAASAAVRDLVDGSGWTVHRRYRGYTASIVKADILETLLQRTRRLTPPTRVLARRMIELSSNHAATALWHVVGEGPGVGRYNRRARLRCTTPGFDGYWGTTITCAADQVRLLARLARPNRLLSRRDRAYELALMRHVTPAEAWGVTGAVPRGVKVALKNGWLAEHATYNSIGWVHGRG